MTLDEAYAMINAVESAKQAFIEAERAFYDAGYTYEDFEWWEDSMPEVAEDYQAALNRYNKAREAIVDRLTGRAA